MDLCGEQKWKFRLFFSLSLSQEFDYGWLIVFTVEFGENSLQCRLFPFSLFLNDDSSEFFPILLNFRTLSVFIALIMIFSLFSFSYRFNWNDRQTEGTILSRVVLVYLRIWTVGRERQQIFPTAQVLFSYVSHPTFVERILFSISHSFIILLIAYYYN